MPCSSLSGISTCQVYLLSGTSACPSLDDHALPQNIPLFLVLTALTQNLEVGASCSMRVKSRHVSSHSQQFTDQAPQRNPDMLQVSRVSQVCRPWPTLARAILGRTSACNAQKLKLPPRGVVGKPPGHLMTNQRDAAAQRRPAQDPPWQGAC